MGQVFQPARESPASIDIQIAAIALSLGNCTVVTKDSDFVSIPRLHVEDWSKA